MNVLLRQKRSLLLFIAAAVSALVYLSCQKPAEKPTHDTTGQIDQITPTSETLAFEPEESSIPLAEETKKKSKADVSWAPVEPISWEKSWDGGIKLSMPSSYLEAPMVFEGLETPTGEPAMGFAVVASDLAALYEAPEDDEISEGDLKSIAKITPIPFGSTLSIESRVRNADLKYDGLVQFEDHLNYFYKTSFNGKNGMVFGADLEGLGKDKNDIARLAWYYTKPAVSPAFRPLAGMKELAPQYQERLEKDHISFAPPPKYYLSLEKPDDLISVYQDACKDRANTIFLTTDLYSHSLHLLFDRLLSEVEEERFIPILSELLDEFLAEVELRIEGDDASVPAWTEALDLAKNYFSIAKALIDMAPPSLDDEFGRMEHSDTEDARAEADWRSLSEGLSTKAVEELELIMKAAGFSQSPCFNYKEDYSQFRPRGHYTKNPRLMAYFRTMMFLGRIHFYLEYSTESAEAVSKLLGPAALLINQIYLDSPSIAQKWHALFDPITWLVGESDDINFYDMESALGPARDADLKAWIVDGHMEQELKRISTALRPPKIQGNITYGNANAAIVEGSGDLFGEPPKGWRLFGQRFTLDSSWTDRLTGAVRTMAEGIDIAAALGSKTAYRFWEPNSVGYPDSIKTLDEIIEENRVRPTEEWQKSFYNHYLRLTGTMMSFEAGQGLYYAVTEAWNKRVLQSGLAAWAELRHDTILYVKQSYAEASGGGDYEPTFRTRPFKRPSHLIEPNLPFFYALVALLEGGIPLLEQHELITKNYHDKLEWFQEIVNRSLAIVEKQAQDRAIDAKDNDWIITVPNTLARIVVPAGSHVSDSKQLRMAVIADVHTDSDNGLVLEVGTGKPLTLYLAVNDGFGGKRIAQGFTYSYYEFPHPMSDRLTNEKWREFIYSDPKLADKEAKRPWWLRETIGQ